MPGQTSSSFWFRSSGINGIQGVWRKCRSGALRPADRVIGTDRANWATSVLRGDDPTVGLRHPERHPRLCGCGTHVTLKTASPLPQCHPRLVSIGATSPSRRLPPVPRHPHLCSYRKNVTLAPERNGHSQHDARGSGSDQVPSKSDWGTAETPCVCGSFDPAGDGRTRLRQRPPWQDGHPTPLARARFRLSGPSGRLRRVAGLAHLGRQRGEGLVGHAHSRTIGP